MFIQVIHGKTSDAEGLSRRGENWREEMMPEAEGFLGSTSGVADNGEAVTMVRFESEEAARRNSDSDRQSQWWEETSKYFDGQPAFYEYTNIETDRGGGSDDAGFVQFIIGKVKDVQQARELMDSLGNDQNSRPDLIGTITGWGDDGHFTTAAYFTSEEEARKGESSGMSEQEQEVMKKWQELMKDVSYVDIKNPEFASK